MSDTRRSPRTKLNRVGRLTGADGATIANCIILDLSSHGALLYFGKPPVAPDQFHLKIGTDASRLVRVARRERDRLGVAFVQD